MATINQSPAGQASVTLSGISFNGITATATPVRTGLRLAVQGGSFAVNLGCSPQPPGPTIPTTGQIWPLGIPVVTA
jgi:hypothetical protein